MDPWVSGPPLAVPLKYLHVSIYIEWILLIQLKARVLIT